MTKQSDMVYLKPGGQHIQIGTGGTLNIHSGGTFSIGGTTVTASAAELNILDGVTATSTELDILDGQVAGVTFTTPTVTSSGSNMTWTMQLIDALGADIASRQFVTAYISRDANGDALISTAPKALAISGDGLLLPFEATTSRIFGLVSESDGDIALNINHEALTAYLTIITPDGQLHSTAGQWN